MIIYLTAEFSKQSTASTRKLAVLISKSLFLLYVRDYPYDNKHEKVIKLANNYYTGFVIDQYITTAYSFG